MPGILGGLILKLSDKVALTRAFTARKKIRPVAASVTVWTNITDNVQPCLPFMHPMTVGVLCMVLAEPLFRGDPDIGVMAASQAMKIGAEGTMGTNTAWQECGPPKTKGRKCCT